LQALGAVLVPTFHPSFDLWHTTKPPVENKADIPKQNGRYRLQDGSNAMLMEPSMSSSGEGPLD